MSIPSCHLHTAIREAIQAHADQYRGGKVDLAKALGALGEAAFQLLAEIPDVPQRVTSANALTNGIACAVKAQIEAEDVRSITHQ